MPLKRNHYKILGISPDADEKEIRAAYRNLAKKYHPDAGEGSSAERFRVIQEAYDLLSDADKRIAYDRTRAKEAGTPVYMVHNMARSLHLDLRDIMKQRSGIVCEPIIQQPFRTRDVDDPWEELIEFFFKRF